MIGGTSMIEYFIDVKKLIPYDYKKSIYDVDYAKLYAEGCRIILTDLDNTLISYKEHMPDDKLLKWKEEVTSLGFEIVLISNSRKKRVSSFAKKFGTAYQHLATKPLKRGYKKALKKASRKYKNEEVLFLGDQLMTDVFGASRLNYRTILIEAVERKTDKWFTRINRSLEKRVVKRIKRKYPDDFNRVLKEYSYEHYGL